MTLRGEISPSNAMLSNALNSGQHQNSYLHIYHVVKNVFLILLINLPDPGGYPSGIISPVRRTVGTLWLSVLGFRVVVSIVQQSRVNGFLRFEGDRQLSQLLYTSTIVSTKPNMSGEEH